MKRYHLFFLMLAVIFASSILLINSTLSIDSEPKEISFDHHKIYQLRTYTTHEGKLDDLHERFTNHTMDFFKKYGMENIAYWTPDDPELKDNTLIYIVAHESLEAAEKSWQDFVNDPEWQEVYEASRANGPIVENIESVYMSTTPYSPME